MPQKNDDLDNSTGYEVVRQSATCKYCGNTIYVQRNVPKSPKIKNTFNEMGGIIGTCNKCARSTSFIYEISRGQFIKLDRVD